MIIIDEFKNDLENVILKHTGLIVKIRQFNFEETIGTHLGLECQLHLICIVNRNKKAE